MYNASLARDKAMGAGFGLQRKMSFGVEKRRLDTSTESENKKPSPGKKT